HEECGYVLHSSVLSTINGCLGDEFGTYGAGKGIDLGQLIFIGGIEGAVESSCYRILGKCMLRGECICRSARFIGCIWPWRFTDGSKKMLVRHGILLPEQC